MPPSCTVGAIVSQDEGCEPAEVGPSLVGDRRWHVELASDETCSHSHVQLRDDLSTYLLVVWYIRRAIDGACGDDKVFAISDGRFRHRFYDGLAGLGVADDHPYIPYSLRAGGATQLDLEGWSHTDIQARGRWASLTSCERYIASALAMQEMDGPLPGELRHRARRLLRDPLCLMDKVSLFEA